MDNRGDILQLCRLCLVKDDVNTPIFEEQGDIRQIFLKISSCLPVKVSRDDKLPKKICDGCSYKLDMLYEFWNTTANAEKQLLTWLGEAGMNAKMTDGTISAVAQQIKPVETVVKQEALDPSDIHGEEHDDKSYMFQQKFTEEDAGPSATVTSNEEEPPPPKRARRTAAVKAQIAMDPDSDEDDDSGEPLTKVEDESEYSEGDDHEPAFVDVPSTSTDDQPGPSGVGKDGGEAPSGTTDSETENAGIKNKPISPMVKKPLTDAQRVKKSEKKKWQLRRKCIKPQKIASDHPPLVQLDEPLECDKCKATFTNNVSFAVHSIRHTADGRYTCHICKAKILTRYILELHVRAHEGTTKFKCDICDRSFTSNKYMKDHKFVHTGGEKHYQCEFCGKKYHTSGKLSVHRHSAHAKKIKGSQHSFQCGECDKSYSTIVGLKKHKMTKHQKVDLSVVCETCGKKLSSKEKLKFHMRTHTGYKPHGCHICPKSFSKKEQLVEHIRIHTGEKPYVCKECGRGFAQRTPLKVHERTHYKNRIAKKETDTDITDTDIDE